MHGCLVEFPDRKVLDFNFQTIQLNRLSWRDYLNRMSPVASALMTKMNMQPNERAHVKMECLRMLARLGLDPARTQLVSGFVDGYLKLDPEEEREFEVEMEGIGSPEEKEATMQIVTSWMQRGIEQEQEEIVFRQLRRRFGDLPEEIKARIESLTSARLGELAESLLDFRDLDDARSWLRVHS